MIETPSCLWFEPGYLSSPSFVLDLDPTSTLTQVAGKIWVGSFTVRAYKIPTEVELSSLDWLNWDQTVARLVPLDLETKANAVEGRILLVKGIRTTVSRSSAASGGSSTPSESTRIRSRTSASQPPSEASKLENFKKRQRANDQCTIYHGRPVERTGPHVCCYSQTFYDFKVAVRKPDNIADNDERLPDALQLMDVACDYFDSETQRQIALAPILSTLCPNVQWRVTPYCNSDGRGPFSPDASSVTWATLDYKAARKIQALACLGEFKNEIGTGGSNPEHQAACCYELYCRWPEVGELSKRSCVPVFLVALAGKDMVIDGAMYLDGPIVHQLYATQLQVHDQDPVDAAKLLIHVFECLSASVESLLQFYQSLSLDVIPPSIVPSYPITGWEVAWIGSLIPSEPRHGRMVFSANVVSSTYSGLAVIKFSRTYSQAAHRKMQALGAAAPLLHYTYDKIIGRHIVVTRFLHEAQVPLGGPDLQRLRAALKQYHAAGFVFGDLRLPNIVRDEDGLKLIDFDWAGLKDKAHYPKINTALNWAHGVRSYELIKPEHDMAMLDLLEHAA